MTMLKDYSSLPNSQFAFVIRKLWQDKVELKRWADEQGKDELVLKLEKEIHILKEAERRLELP